MLGKLIRAWNNLPLCAQKAPLKNTYNKKRAFLEIPMRSNTLLSTALAGALLSHYAHAAPLPPQPPFSFDSASGRLPKNVVPTDYTIAIVPDAAALTLRGDESVSLNFRAATDTIAFNSLNMTLDHVLFDGKPVKAVVSSDEQQLSTVTLKRKAAVGKHTLSFSYNGKIERGPQGMFAQNYARQDGGKGLLLSTKFEATDARRMFPCWDEPSFRATFKLSVTAPAAWSGIANMPVEKRVQHGALATTTFQRTPKMPTYLVEYTGGDMARIDARVGPTDVGLWAVRGQEQDGAVALANAQQILADYNDYFGYPYPLPKLDSIAIPGGFSGAMENWGAITYNDQALLITKSSTLGDRQTAFSIQAHELAHQWNGDLVTMGWWDDLWLNESFASWRAAKEIDARNPNWDWRENQDGTREYAMAADARASSPAVQQHVSNELEARSAFDPAITYGKGQMVLTMLEAYLGDDTFRDGIRAYMKAHAYSNTSAGDLWNALSLSSGRDVGALAALWIQQPGYPLVSVNAQCDAAGQRTIALSQKRFLLQGEDAAHTHWNVPLQIRVGVDAAPHTVLLTEDGQTVAAGRCDQPLSVNATRVGFFRVAYDAATLANNTRAFAQLPRGDRIALLDDQWALSEIDPDQLPAYLALASAMGDTLNQRAWEQITDALDTIETFERNTPGHAAFAKTARAVVKPIADRLGWDGKADETPGIQRLRRRVLADLGAWGDPAVIAEARRRFALFVADRNAIKADDQALVLTIVARDADAATFEQLHAIARASRNETEIRRYYAALMSVRDPQLALQARDIALSAEIPAQAAEQRRRFIFALADEHPKLSWDTYTENLELLLASSPQYRSVIIAGNTPSIYGDYVPLDELEVWLKSKVPAAMYPNVARGMESARFKQHEKALMVQAADRYVASRH